MKTKLGYKDKTIEPSQYDFEWYDLSNYWYGEIRTKKIVIMGLARSGVTTVFQRFIYPERPPLDPESEYHATIDYEIHQKFIHGSWVTLYDLGGQTAFLDRFIGPLAELIFSEINSLVFIFDSIEIGDIARAKYYLDIVLDLVFQYNPEASVFLFQHKIDLIPKSLKEELRQSIKSYLVYDINHKLQYYETSDMTNSIIKAINAVMNATRGRWPHKFSEHFYTHNDRLYTYREVRENKEEDKFLTRALREALKILQEKVENSQR